MADSLEFDDQIEEVRSLSEMTRSPRDTTTPFPPVDDPEPLPLQPNGLPMPDAAIQSEYGGGYDVLPQMPGPVPLPLPPTPDPWSQNLQPTAIRGVYDSWAGRVDGVHYASADGLLGCVQSIEVTRVDVRWGTNNEPEAQEIPPAASQPQRQGEVALPWPPRHDQAGYHVTVGDIVACFTGRDGRVWFLSDELPFIARVVTQSALADTTEDNNGGAGLEVLCVRRQLLTDDPDDAGYTGVGLADLQYADDEFVQYTFTQPICPDGVFHGYRIGDRVVVQRRGRYMFVWPTRQMFPAVIAAKGPDDEDDFATNHYWVKEEDWTVSYTVNSWTAAQDVRPLMHPDTGYGDQGRYGRWVDAMNLAEAADSHALNAGDRILVFLVAGAGDLSPAYVFERDTGQSLCQHDTLDPIAEDAESGLPAATNITGDPTLSTTYFATGWMYRDEDGKMNPWICITSIPHKLLSATHADTVADDVVRGDVITGQDVTGANWWKRLPIRAVDYDLVLTVLGGNGTDIAHYGLDNGAAPPAGNQAVTFVVDNGNISAYTADASGGTTHELLSATHTDTVVNGVSRGSLIYGNATPKWDEFVKPSTAADEENHKLAGIALAGWDGSDFTSFRLSDGQDTPPEGSAAVAFAVSGELVTGSVVLPAGGDIGDGLAESVRIACHYKGNDDVTGPALTDLDCRGRIIGGWVRGEAGAPGDMTAEDEAISTIDWCPATTGDSTLLLFQTQDGDDWIHIYLKVDSADGGKLKIWCDYEDLGAGTPEATVIGMVLLGPKIGDMVASAQPTGDQYGNGH